MKQLIEGTMMAKPGNTKMWGTHGGTKPVYNRKAGYSDPGYRQTVFTYRVGAPVEVEGKSGWLRIVAILSSVDETIDATLYWGTVALAQATMPVGYMPKMWGSWIAHAMTVVAHINGGIGNWRGPERRSILSQVIAQHAALKALAWKEPDRGTESGAIAQLVNAAALELAESEAWLAMFELVDNERGEVLDLSEDEV